MDLVLGIDTGGTYTDAVLVEHATGQVVAGAKALTTRHDLAIGIAAAIRAVFAAATDAGTGGSAHVILVALSTTLATNTLAEGQRGAVCLVLIGYDPALMRAYDFERELATDDVIYVGGGHDAVGDEAAALDEAAARAAIVARRESVEAFAISGYFSVRNPAHELRVKALVEELTGLPATCGHELTSQFNAVRRATTVALNAHLIAPLTELIASVQATLSGLGIAAPLMVVKGDGSLVRAEWALQRPIETVLSGPAASAVGAWHLAGRRDVWTVDVGGTTTDIAALCDGRPRLNAQGAQVGGWRTMVEAVDVHTTGLGGDSHVRFDGEGQLSIGPRRAVPLSLLASEHPGIIAELRRQVDWADERWDDGVAEFMVLGRPARGRLSEPERDILDRLAQGPRSLAHLIERSRGGGLARRRLIELEGRGLVRRAGFTPSDALHVLGRFCAWNVEAAQIAATLLARRILMDPAAFCQRVVERFSQRVATELITKVLEDEAIRPDWAREATAAAFLRWALNGREPVAEGRAADLACALTLRRPVVAIGAPVVAYLPRVAESLHTELIIPPHAEVANAVGAVSSSIIQRAQAFISPLDEEGRVRLHLPDGVRDFGGVRAAAQYAEQMMPGYVEALARRAGAEQVEVSMARVDQTAPVKGSVDQAIYLGSEITFVAAGRPSPARS